jgi:hypothetical protein
MRFHANYKRLTSNMLFRTANEGQSKRRDEVSVQVVRWKVCAVFNAAIQLQSG